MRDLAAHLGPWLAEAEVQLERLTAGTYEGHDVDIDALNAAFLEAMRDQPWHVAWTQANAGRTRMLQEWYALDEQTDEAAWWLREVRPRPLPRAPRPPARVGRRADRPAPRRDRAGSAGRRRGGRERSGGSTMTDEAWPALPYPAWAPTKKTLHMVAQMVGKVRLALAPPQPEWLHACLYLDARGFTTGAIPCGTRVITIRIDLHESAIVVDRDDGRRARVALGPARPVAAIWADFRDALSALGVEAVMSDKPQELVDPSPFSLNVRRPHVRCRAGATFHRVLCAIDGAFEEFRSGFFGRTGVQFWWGSFDFCVLIFSGRHLPGPEDRGYIMRHDLDAEQMNAGFWAGRRRFARGRLLRVHRAAARRLRARPDRAVPRGLAGPEERVDHVVRSGADERRPAEGHPGLPGQRVPGRHHQWRLGRRRPALHAAATHAASLSAGHVRLRRGQGTGQVNAMASEVLAGYCS